MNYKKQRNYERNEKKKAQRRREVDVQIITHNANLSAQLFTAQPNEKPPDTSGDVDPYATEILVKSIEEYRKVDPELFFITVSAKYKEEEFPEDRLVKPDPIGYSACIVANRPEGPEIVSETRNWFKTPEVALNFASQSFQVIAIRREDGTAEYPHFRQGKANAMAQARIKRERKSKREKKQNETA